MSNSLVYGQTKTNSVTPPTVTQNENAVFKLYQTTNMWTFLKLNTRNGEIDQVQFHTDEKNRGEYYLNLKPLVTKEKEKNADLLSILTKIFTHFYY